MVLICSGTVWWGMRWLGVDSGMYGRAAALGMPLEPEDLVPNPPIPPEENAAPLMIEAATQIVGLNIDGRLVLRRARGTETEKKLARYELEKAEAALLVAKQAADRPRCYIERDWAMGVFLRMPELGNFKKIVQMLSARAILAAEAGDIQAAVVDLETAFSVAHHAGQEPHLISMLLRISCEVITLRAIEVIADEAREPAVLDRLRRVVEDHQQPIIIFDNIRGEVTMAAAIARNLENADELKRLSDNLDSPDTTSPRQIVRSGAPANARVRAQLNLYLKHWEPIFELGEDARDNRKLDPVLRKMDETSENLQSPNDIFSAILLPVFSQAVDAEIKLGATTTATLAYLDVLEHRLRTGSLPASLPGDYPDPFSDGALKYRVEGDGFRIWSIGPDKVDDGGKTSQELGKKAPAGDAVLIHPTPAPNE